MPNTVKEIRVGIIGGGYMGKAHAAAARAAKVNAELSVNIELEGVAASSQATAEKYKKIFGYKQAFNSASLLIGSPEIDAVIIASPQATHLEYVRLCATFGKPVLCEKPMGQNLSEAIEIVKVTKELIHMVGYNYIHTPSTAYARSVLNAETLGDIIWYRGEHHEDFLVKTEGNEWRQEGEANGTLGDLMPHPIHCALALAGPIVRVIADIRSRPSVRGRPPSKGANDDQAHLMCEFKNGANGLISASRVAHGRKMGLAYEIHCTKGAIRFDQEDQNCLWIYRAGIDQGFQRVLAGPGHGGYSMFCQGPGHGTGYQDQIILEQIAFYRAILGEIKAWPSFTDGLEVMQVCDAIRVSHDKQSWTDVGG